MAEVMTPPMATMATVVFNLWIFRCFRWHPSLTITASFGGDTFYKCTGRITSARFWTSACHITERPCRSICGRSGIRTVHISLSPVGFLNGILNLFLICISYILYSSNLCCFENPSLENMPLPKQDYVSDIWKDGIFGDLPFPPS